MASEVEELLTSKGPGKIPAWGYGVGLAGAFLVFEWFRNKNSANTAAQNTPAAPAPGTTTVTTKTSGGGGGWGAPWPWRPFYTLGPPGPPTIQTNTEWRHMAADWLETKGYRSGEVNDVLEDYLSGQRLDRTDQRIVDLAVDEWGRPPQAVSGTGGFVGPGGQQTEADQADTGAAGPDTAVSGPGRASGSVRDNVRVDVREDRRRRRRLWRLPGGGNGPRKPTSVPGSVGPRERLLRSGGTGRRPPQPPRT